MSTHESAEKKHSSFGDRLKGAAHIVHGIGEDIRGSVMGAFESASGSAEEKAKDDEIAAKGKDEIQQGIAKMKGVEVPASTTMGPAPHGQGKTGDLPQEQPVVEAVPGPTPAPPPSPIQSRLAEQGTTRQEPSGQTQAGTEEMQKGSQETQAPTGDKGLTDTSIPEPQGPGSGM